MIRSAFILFFTGLCLFFWGCSDDTETTTLDDGPGEYKADYKTSADFFTLQSGSVAGNSPHGTVQMWYSSNMRSLVDQDSFTVPKGTVSIKEFDNDGSPGVDGLAIMIKKEAGYDAENNDWLYEMRGMDGSVMDSGKLEMCIGCHQNFASKDYLGGTNMRD